MPILLPQRLARVLILSTGLWATLTACEGEPPKSSPKVARAEAEAIHIVLVGDSTVTERAGWGKAFAKLLLPDVRCSNQASGGASSRSYLDDGSWKAALAERPTHVLIQFGHNDMFGRAAGLGTDPETAFPANLRRMVDEARAAGAEPILVSPIPRRVFEDGKLRGDLAPYSEAARRVAAEKKVPLADLYARGVEALEKLGPQQSEELGPWLPTGRRDPTHLAKPGAKLTANQLAAELRRVAPALARFVRSIRDEP